MAVLTPTPKIGEEIYYPDSDGQPMADNTKQADLIVLFKTNFDLLFAERADVFVAMDLLWYPVQGKPEVRAAPDVMIAFGRPKGDRGSYRQWQENGVAPQVAFEILSPGNRLPEMLRKFGFYDRYGVEEYYIYDTDNVQFYVALRQDGQLTPQDFDGGFVSPRLAVRFSLPEGAEELEIYRPDGARFTTYVEIAAERKAIEIERDTVTKERDAIEVQRDAVTKERDAIAGERDAVAIERDALALERNRAQERAERLAAKLREMGISEVD